MKLNDPFGRVGRRRAQAYAAFREQLDERGLRDRAALATLANSMNRSVLTWAAVTLLGAALASLLFPDLRAIIIVFAVIILLWLGTSWWQARLHLRRYRIENTPSPAPQSKGGDS